MFKINNIVLERKEILRPRADVEWASEMVLNPAVIKDPDTGVIHMLVRVSGPCDNKRMEGKPSPFPIFLAYAWSQDGGETFEFDFSRPALAPNAEYELDKLYIENGRGEKTPNFTNGSIEDPRLFFVEGECYCTAACRMFPPGPYWIKDDPVQCMPEWAKGAENPFNTQKNPTVTVLYHVDLKELAAKNYEKAFKYITNLTDAKYGEDRDVFLFPEKMRIDGKDMYVMLHRPYKPCAYEGLDESRPSIVIAAAEDFYSFADNAYKRRVLYAPEKSWQNEKVGGSTPPVNLGGGEWLFNYHGKENDIDGYAQSFMILKDRENDFPVITHLCDEKWIVNEAEFENPGRFKIPCIFFTGLIKNGDNLLVSYGAADERAGVMTLDFEKLVRELRKYPKSV